jgi:hypothetical protein
MNTVQLFWRAARQLNILRSDWARHQLAEHGKYAANIVHFKPRSLGQPAMWPAAVCICTLTQCQQLYDICCSVYLHTDTMPTAVWHMTFIWPCIEIYCYRKTNRCTSFSNLFYFVVALYMFRTVFPSIIRSLRLYIQHQVYVIHILLTACSRERDGTSRSREQAVLDSWWWTERPPETCRVPLKNKINFKLVHLVAFTIQICM